ncbi:type IX secretion system sortase PorU [Hymenobacter setariae]|uniref:Type IX secretion system sortase PorU n=1 Tax=Hymenobacter setariae TaxID=2594794 RepID=A0A558BVP9_9BACT|nr:type IX secretion system sortase PorU [Hymenobacter setariae]TVT40605.1 type IX secretion system sortase PorU [Hymenobacter setariae]
MQRLFRLFGLLVLLAGWSVPAQAQSSGEQTIATRLSWDTYATLALANGSTRKVPTFQGAYHGPGEAIGTLTLRIPGTVAAGTVRDAVYEPFSTADAALLRTTTLPALPGVRVRYGTEARQPISYALVQPVRRNAQSGQPERLVSFTYAYQLGDAPASAARTTAVHTFAQRSVLQSGDWFKIGVPTNGIYKLDRTALSSLGLPVASIDPRRIQIYGNATGVLPQANAAPRPDDLVENNVLLVGDNNDGVFDAGEYFLFYAPGPHVWAIDSTNKVPTGFRHINNVYADTAYYFVTVGSANGRRVPTAAAPASPPSGAPITTFTDRRFYEHDLTNLLHSGRQWLGERFAAGSSQEVSFNSDNYTNQALADLVPGSPARLRVAVAASSLQSSSFQVSFNGTALPTTLPIAAISTVAFTTVANTYVGNLTTTLPASPAAEQRVRLSFSSNDPSATTSGYLDYLELLVQRQLRLSASALEFRSLALRGAGSVGTYALDNATGAQVWEVTNPRRARAQAFVNGSFAAYTDSVREYVAFQPNGTFDTPRLFGKVANQNLHALNANGTLDLVIVTYPPFRAQAERLAQHRRTYSGLNVAVVTTKEVFNEYASGAQDVTAIRDLMKQVYDRNPNPASRRNYLLLFGDASFDYKASAFNDQSKEPAWWRNSRRPFANDSNLDPDLYNQNLVPTYESRESFLPVAGNRAYAEGVSSYSSEDYFGLLDDNEGTWAEFDGGRYEACDIGVGRIPVRPPRARRDQATSDEQARQVVDKLIAYDGTASFGKWRNRLTLTADDNDPAIGMTFTTESESIFAPALQAAEPAYNIRKTYLDLFPQQTVAAGQRSPAAEAAINDALNQGSLLIGYTGHGGIESLTDERIITKASLLALTNQNRLTFFVTGTCDLSTYDDPDLKTSGVSAGEAVLTDNATAGAVGLFTTTRVVYSYQNTQLVTAFYSQVLARSPAGDLPYLGNASRLAKVTAAAGDLNNRNYTLLADPTTRLAYPRQRVLIDSINGRKVTSLQTSLDTLKALGQVRLSGHVENKNVLNASFNGTADISIFDKPTGVYTLGDQGGDTIRVKVQENVVYSGQATVRAGRFSVKFVVPKDINYSAGLGKISLYAADLTNQVDAQGYQLVPVGGAAKGAATDVTPPTVQLFMDDDSFVSGGLTGVNTLLLGKLFDLSGINTSNAGVGHELTATLDNDPAKLVVINDSYSAAVDDFTRGQLRYNYQNLAPGPHILKVKAWDTYNNSAEGSVEFIAAQTAQLALDHVLNYPNPFSNLTTFHFDHNKAGQELEVQVQIFTVAGRLVKTLHASALTSTSHNQSVSWDGRDDFNDQLARGVYVYRISVRSPADQQTVSKFEKLVLLN